MNLRGLAGSIRTLWVNELKIYRVFNPFLSPIYSMFSVTEAGSLITHKPTLARNSAYFCDGSLIKIKRLKMLCVLEWERERKPQHQKATSLHPYYHAHIFRPLIKCLAEGAVWYSESQGKHNFIQTQRHKTIELMRWHNVRMTIIDQREMQPQTEKKYTHCYLFLVLISSLHFLSQMCKTTVKVFL